MYFEQSNYNVFRLDEFLGAIIILISPWLKARINQKSILCSKDYFLSHDN